MSLDALLRDVSRSFYLTLRALPSAIRPQIGLAYLLARATDTIADTDLVPLEIRLQALRQLRARILGEDSAALDLGAMAKSQASPAEATLLARHGEAVMALNAFSEADRRRVRDVLTIIIGGQELDLRRFAGASARHINALATEAETDDYTYRVAGCVGEFWTRMCRAHLFPNAPLDDAFLMENGVRFGKGLQLVNILRDLPKDLQQGRCYLAAETLAAAGLAPSDLVESENEPRFRPVYHGWLAKAEGHLAAGWDYTNALPRGCVRVRLACAWPLLIGIKTVQRLRGANVLDASQRVKISRADVRGILARSVLYYPWQSAWNRLFPRP